MPASVIGLVLLFIALCTGIVKLEQVETVGTALTNNISFLFVPAGISVINSFAYFKQKPNINYIIDYYFYYLVTRLHWFRLSTLSDEIIIPF